MDSRQISEWLEFSRLEPFGSLVDDFRAGVICSTLANYAGRVRKDNAGSASPDEFFPSLKTDKPKNAPILLSDPKEQSRLIFKTIFKKDL